MTRHINRGTGLAEFGYYGDWCAVKSTPKRATSSFSFVLAVSRLVSMAEALLHADAIPGIHADAAHYNASLKTYRRAWHKLFFTVPCPTIPNTHSQGCALQGKSLPACTCKGKLAAVAMECEPTGHGVPPPTCGMQNNTRIRLECKNNTGIIQSIDFAGYGQISGSCATGFSIATVGGIPQCHSPATMAAVAAVCVGKSFCELNASIYAVANGTDPCPGKGKVLAVMASGCEPATVLPPPPPSPPPPEYSGCYATNTQTGNAMALYLEIPPTEEIRQATMQALVADYHAAQDHPTFGTVGARIFLPVLAAGDQMDLALDFATKLTQPSYGYMVSTPEMPGTIWEQVSNLLTILSTSRFDCIDNFCFFICNLVGR
eukprot:SAG31_NODE_2268_length_6049_cov_1.979835_2_plen_374_part_00